MAISGPVGRRYRALRSVRTLRLSNGVAWMALAQVFFAGMNICTRLGARGLSWAEIAAAGFLVGAVMAAATGWVRGSPLWVGDQPAAWRRSIAVVRPSFGLAAPVAAIATAGAMFWALAMIWLRKIGVALFRSARLAPLALAQLDRLGLSARGRARRRSRPGDHGLEPIPCIVPPRSVLFPALAWC